MNLITFVRIIFRNLKWLVSAPLLVAFAVIYFTRNMPKDYSTNTVIYTGIASGYDITTGENSKVDYFAVNTAFDNFINIIKARETVESVALQLMTQHLLLEEPKVNVLGKDGFAQLNELISDSLRTKFVVAGDYDATLANILEYKKASVKNEIEEILASSGSYYSISKIRGSMAAKRVQSSDLIEIAFTSSDPGVAQHTLFFLANTFMDRYKGLKGMETSSVVDYFEKRLNDAFSQLQLSEDKLKNFGIDNRIINYQEQSKFIAEAKENLDSELYHQKMKNEAAKAAIGRLELQMSDLIAQLKNNDELARKRKQLGKVNILLSNAQAYEESSKTIDSLNRESYLLQEEIKEIVEKYYDYSHSIEGIESNKVLEQWLSKIIEYEETSANLKVFEERKQEFDSIYDTYAPLGSTLGKLEREVGISEQQYLSVLHGLNMAQLRQQNLEMSNTISIMDKPFFPIKPKGSKRGMLVIVAFIAVFFAILTTIIVREYLDNSIKYPARARDEIELPVVGALPNRNTKNKTVNIDDIESTLMEQVISTLNLKIINDKLVRTQYLSIIYSIRPREGKTTFAVKMIQKLTEINGKVLFLTAIKENPNPEYSDPDYSNSKITHLKYDVNSTFLEVSDWKSLVSESIDFEEYKFVFIELPSLNRKSIPAELVSKADFSLLLVNANRVWRTADKHLNGLFLKAMNGFTMVVLNKVQIDFLENLLGEIPKRRSRIRRIFKKVILFNFRKN